MLNFEESIDSALIVILKLSAAHLALFQMSNLKIINRQQLSSNPFISDQLDLCKRSFTNLKGEIEIDCEQLKQIIGIFATQPKIEQAKKCKDINPNILLRIISRSIQAMETAAFQHENQYYKFYNQKFRSKCRKMIADVKQWQVFEIIRVLYKYFRHIVLIQVERYQEILDCLTQTDFASIPRFNQHFYNVLQKKQSQKREMKFKSNQETQNNPKLTANQGREKQQVIDSGTFHHINVNNYLVDHSQQSKQFLENHRNKNHLQKDNFQSHFVNQYIQTDHPLPEKTNPNTKFTSKNKNFRKTFNQISSLMNLKKDNDIIREERSIYSDLFLRNRQNHLQIQSYFNYSKHVKEHLNYTDPNTFFYYQQDPQLVNHKDSEMKHLRMVLPSDKELMFRSAEFKKDSGFLTNNLQKRKEHKTIHKSIDCKNKHETQNAQLVEQKPLKIDSQFLQISLKKVLPTRRLSQLDKMVSRASSLGIIKHDLHSKRIKMISQNVGKAIESDIFKSVKILHQGKFSIHKQAKIPKGIKEIQVNEHNHYDKIDNVIKQQLKNREVKPQELKKIWRDQIALKKIQFS